MTDFDKAMLDPTSVFRTPQEVVRQADLSRDQKIDLLLRWAYDAHKLEGVEVESQPSPQPDILNQILQSLHVLNAKLED